MKYLKRIREIWRRGFWKNQKDPEFMDINPDQASLKKVIYWRVLSTFISMTIAYYYLNEISTSIEMTMIEAAILTNIHYVYEEMWGIKKK